MFCINIKKQSLHYVLTSHDCFGLPINNTHPDGKNRNVLPIVDFNHLPFADYHKGKRHLQQTKRKEDDANLSSPLKNASTPTPSSLILLQTRMDLLHLATSSKKNCFDPHTIFTHPSTKHNRLASFSRHHLSRRFTTNFLYKQQEQSLHYVLTSHDCFGLRINNTHPDGKKQKMCFL